MFLATSALLLCLLCGQSSSLRRNHVIHWNTSNPIFRIDNTDHILDVNHGNEPWEYDQVNIICPNYSPSSTTQKEDDDEEEKYIIYNVSKEEYETCRILNPHPRIVALCDKPHELLYFTISFRSFTPTPGGMEFKPGRDYYFISTSSPSDLKSKNGGRCSSHNMKIAFKVASREPKNVFPLRIPGGKEIPRRRRPHPREPPYPKLYPPLHPYQEAASSSSFRRHPNDVVKHEASRMDHSRRASDVNSRAAHTLVPWLPFFLLLLLMPLFRFSP